VTFPTEEVGIEEVGWYSEEDVDLRDKTIDGCGKEVDLCVRVGRGGVIAVEESSGMLSKSMFIRSHSKLSKLSSLGELKTGGSGIIERRVTISSKSGFQKSQK
jgi:hypothetical protein